MTTLEPAPWLIDLIRLTTAHVYLAAYEARVTASRITLLAEAADQQAERLCDLIASSLKAVPRG